MMEREGERGRVMERERERASEMRQINTGSEHIIIINRIYYAERIESVMLHMLPCGEDDEVDNDVEEEEEGETIRKQ